MRCNVSDHLAFERQRDFNTFIDRYKKMIDPSVRICDIELIFHCAWLAGSSFEIKRQNNWLKSCEVNRGTIGKQSFI